MFDAPEIQSVRWFKSTRSTSNGNCVEVADLTSGVAVRDSKDPDGPVLLISTGGWRDFVASLRAGAFDQ